MQNIYDYDEEMLKEYLINLGLKPFRSKQIIEWLYRHKKESFDEMTNLSKDFIMQLKKDFYFESLNCKSHQKSADGTQKFLFELSDGNLIESVLMNNDYGYSICVTSEVGCNMGCVFCASGMKKKLRNLKTSEMVLQILTVEKLADVKISHVVVMGIGEPFDNYDNVLSFLRLINNPLGLEIGARHITVSTCGLVPKIKEFADFDLQVNLAISLHAPNDEIRNRIMPISLAYKMDDLISAIRYYIEKTNRRVTIEYILLKDINDSKECAIELSKLIKGTLAYVNLIPFNPVNELKYRRSDEKSVHDFLDTLMKNGVTATIRKEFGTDIDAACGQLRAKNEKK